MSLQHYKVYLLGLCLLLSACGSGGNPNTPINSNINNSAQKTQTENTVAATLASFLSPQALLGKKLFFDESLSASGKMSCATCHELAAGLAQNNRLPSQFGGANLDLQGGRIAPGITYLKTNTAFRFANDGTPTGGFFFDGRATSLADQAGGPFLNPVEMANTTKEDVINKVAKAAYANDFKALYGDAIFTKIEEAYERIKTAIAAYELESKQFNAFNSKYDRFLKGTEQLTAQEMRGLATFNNPQTGNCAACHPSTIASNGAFPLFTDFTYDNLGVPRNPQLKQNNDPNFYDLGLCESATLNLQSRRDLCGMFKVPSLRNVALRKAYFHNGFFTNLRDAVAFYAQRDTNPEKFFPVNKDGTVDIFNDIPANLRQNVNTLEVPMNRKIGMQQSLTEQEIDDLVAFLNTLTDQPIGD